MDTIKEKKKKTTPEEKVSSLTARLKKARNVVSKKNRNQRNGWIVSAGIALEAKYKSFKETEQEKRDMIRSWVDALDAEDERNRTRFLEFLDHLERAKDTPMAEKQPEPATVSSATPQDAVLEPKEQDSPNSDPLRKNLI